MNWFKKANKIPPISVASYSDHTGTLSIFFKGKGPYFYHNVSPYIHEYLQKLLGYKNYKEAEKMLRNLSKNTLYTYEEESEMLEELYEAGLLK